LFGLFEEVLGRDQKYSHTGTLKHMITGETHRIEKKFVSGWEEANHMNAVFLSNEIQPFPIEPSDRRMMVIWPKKTLPEDLQKQVSACIQQGGIEAFYGWLLDQDLSGFDPHTKPHVTAEKQRLIDFGRPGWESFLTEWRNGCMDAPFAPCLVNDLFTVYTQWASARRETVVSMSKFSGFLAVQEGLIRRTDVRYDVGMATVKKGVFILPDGVVPPATSNLQGWYGDCAREFQKHITGETV
jgi:putative DNA primase/helicase